MGQSSYKLSPASRNLAWEVCFRIVVFAIFVALEFFPPFIRTIQPEEIWLYRYPKAAKPFLLELGGPILRFLLQPNAMVAYPLLAIFIAWYRTRRREEMCQMYLIPTLSIPLTGLVINFIKIAVGRPRPNFMYTCYGPYYYLRYYDVSRPCTGDEKYALDGRKSFPSGHTGLAFASFGFLALYIADKGKRIWLDPDNKWKAILTFLPLFLLPTLVGISRTCDYKHHWQDVLVGGLIGILVTCIVYGLYRPGFGQYVTENEMAHGAQNPSAIPTPNPGPKTSRKFYTQMEYNRSEHSEEYNRPVHNRLDDNRNH